MALPEAKIRGYKPGRFSFNMNGGRCETCMGNGYRTIEMNFMPDVYVPCEACHGKRYNRETLEVRYRGKSIADVLDMTIDTACEFFDNIPHILHKIKTLKDVGLGYIKLGQPSTTIPTFANTSQPRSATASLFSRQPMARKAWKWHSKTSPISSSVTCSCLSWTDSSAAAT